MKRRLLNLLTLLSLLACLAAAVLWVRGYHVADALVTARSVYVSGLGKLALWRSYGTEPDIPPEYRGLGRDDPATLNIEIGTALQGSREWSIGGAWLLLDGDRAGGTVLLVVPAWAVVLLTALAPAAWALRRYLRRPRPGHCPACNYDLRATPQRCPECGGIPAAVPT